MKKLFLSIAMLFTAAIASAQVLPSVQFGIKGGINLSQLSSDNTFDNSNKAGYLAGAWLRIGALGFNFQPEVYYASKMAKFTNNNISNTITLNSIDVPLLVGYKVGALGFGGRIYTGPSVSFILSDDQTARNAFSNIVALNYKNQSYAWQFGAGVDIRSLSFDLRYEKGLSNINNSGYDQKLNLFNLTVGYKLF